MTGAILHRQECINVLLIKALEVLSPPSTIYLACVSSKALKQQFIAVTAHLWPDTLLHEVYTVKSAHGVSNAYSTPKKLGVDRWLAMLAAYYQYRAAVCVVDCGTAITLDVVDRCGVHLGGMIMPGLSLMKQALYQGTADLNICAEVHKQGLANNTEAAIFNGNLYAVKGFIESGRAQFKQASQLILTGGDADFLLETLQLDAIVDKDLVLKGLALSIDRQAEK